MNEVNSMGCGIVLGQNNRWVNFLLRKKKNSLSKDSFLEGHWLLTWFNVSLTCYNLMPRTFGNCVSTRHSILYILAVPDRDSGLSNLFPSTSRGIPFNEGLLNRSWSSLLETAFWRPIKDNSVSCWKNRLQGGGRKKEN